MAYTKYKRPNKHGDGKQKKHKILAWSLIGAAAVLLAAAALYFFVLRQPKQPDHPEEMVTQTPAATPTQQVKTTPEPTIIPTTAPEVTPKPLVIQDSFKELYGQNSDIVGWITIENTDIDYPILQSEDNSFYMDKDFYKEYSYPGSIFLDFRCDFTNMYKSAHQIVYGHNMKNGTMFQQLTKYEDEDFFNENRYININTLYGNYIFEVFAAYETPVSYYYLETDFNGKQDWLEFIEGFEERSAYDAGITLSGNDVVLTLSTCTNQHDNKYRFVVQARLTNPELYDTDYDYMY